MKIHPEGAGNIIAEKLGIGRMSMSKNPEKYYHVYEDRYRRVYSQGIEYWSGDPAETDETILLVDEFLEHYSLHPGRASIIEFGCGEGNIAVSDTKRLYLPGG